MRLTIDSHSLKQDLVDPVDTIVKVSDSETEKKTKGHEAHVKDVEEQLRGEIAQLLQREENWSAAFQRLDADNQHLKAELQSRGKVEQHLKNQVAEANRKITRYGMRQQRAEGDARSWRRQYEELRDSNPEAETNVIRFKEMTAANEALMDADTRNKEVINRLETQIKMGLPLKNQLTPYIADVNSNTADRDQLLEQKDALLQAACRNNEAQHQELQTVQQHSDDMLKQGQQLYQENQYLREHCHDLTTRLTLAQQEAETGNVEAAQVQHDALKQEQAARLKSVRIEYEGKMKEEREAMEAQMMALQHQAEEWVNTNLKVFSEQCESNLNHFRANLEAEVAQRLQASQEEIKRLKRQVVKMDDDLSLQAAACVKSTRDLDGFIKSTNDLLKQTQVLVDDNSKLESEKASLEEENAETGDDYLRELAARRNAEGENKFLRTTVHELRDTVDLFRVEKENLEEVIRSNAETAHITAAIQHADVGENGASAP